jgi:hypothetical protein
MNCEIVPIDFMGQGALLQPVDQELHDLALDYSRRELQDGASINLAKYAKTWVAVQTVDGFREVKGIMATVLRPDIPIIRATDEAALSMMAERLQSYFADNGWRGGEVFVHISKAQTPEQYCKGWRQVLITEQKAESADRFTIKVR